MPKIKKLKLPEPVVDDFDIFREAPEIDDGGKDRPDPLPAYLPELPPGSIVDGRTKLKHGRPEKLNPDEWLPKINEQLKLGLSLIEACAVYGSHPSPTQVLCWVRSNSEYQREYLEARQIGWLLMGDMINHIASETHAYTLVQELNHQNRPKFNAQGHPIYKRVLVPLSNDVLKHKALRIDTMKWTLSRMLPRVFGDKVTTEHVGANGGPIQLQNVDYKALSDEELQQMQALLAKTVESTAGK